MVGFTSPCLWFSGAGRLIATAPIIVLEMVIVEAHCRPINEKREGPTHFSEPSAGASTIRSMLGKRFGSVRSHQGYPGWIPTTEIRDPGFVQ